MTKVQPWRQPCCGLQIRMVPVLMVALKTVVEELPPSLVGGHASAFHVRYGGDLMVNVQGEKRLSTNSVAFGRSPNKFQRRLWRVGFLEGQINEVLVHVWQAQRRRQGVFNRKVSEVIFDGLVQMPAKRVRGGERPTCMAHGDEPVSVHEVHLTWRKFHSSLSDLPWHVGGVVVNDQRVGIDAHSGKETPCLPVAGFDVGYVRDSTPEHGRALVDHALQNEGVDAVVGPTVSNR